MFIKSLDIKNFKNITHKQFEFNKINLLSGNNGSGKSSTLESLIFLLTDHLNGKLSEYIKWGFDKFSLDSVFEDFSKDNYKYNIEYDKATKRSLVTDSDQYSGSDASKFLKDIINPTIALFSNISIQGQSTQLLYEKPTARLEKFKLLFGVDDVDRAVEKINIDIDEIRVTIKVLTSEIEILKSKTFSYLEEYELQDYSLLEKQVDNLSSLKIEYEENKKLYDSYIIQLKEYEEKLKIKEDLQEDIQELKDVLQKHEIEYTDVKGLEYDKSEYTQLQMKLEQNIKNRKLKEDLQKKISLIDDKLSNFEERKNSINLQRVAKPSETEEQIKVFEENLQNKKSNLFILKSKYEAVKNGECPTCGAEYSSENVKQLQEKYGAIKKICDDEDINLKALKESYQNFVIVTNTNEIKKEQLSSIEALKETLISEYDSYSLQIEDIYLEDDEDLKNDIESLGEKLNRIKEATSVIYDIQQKIHKKNVEFDLYNNLKKPEEIIIPISFDYILFEEVKKNLYVAKEKEEGLKRIKEMNTKIKLGEKEHTLQITNKEDTLDEKRKKLNLLETSRKILSKDFSSYLVDKGTNFVKNKMNEIFARSYGKYNVTLDRDSKGVNFFYFSHEKNILTSVDMASGYEKQLLSVSFRLALSTLHKLGIFIFDEIDSDSSEENSLRLYRTILAQKYSQIFCVTHKEQTKDYLRMIPYCSEFEF